MIIYRRKMKLWLILIIGVFPLCTFAQENKKISGQVFQNESTLENVFLQNITTKKSTLTNSDGYFSLKATIGDTLLFSRIGFVDYIKILNKADMETKFIKIKMKVRINELIEVNIQNNSEINAVSEGIIPRKVKKLSTHERRLQTAGDFKWIDLLGLLGGSLEIDPILNAINGRTNRLKRNIEIEKKLRNIAILEGYSAYLQEEMNLSQKEAQRIISLAGEDEEAQLVIDSKNPNRIKMFLVANWIKYKRPE
ncbi:carboxypeptidase-like regulatory domain-containing protein [uncultured Salegentibacter sp.]|uniref:carboxypeptidase-like regulatory domain-containing protein n=1 Tax=uncultured Salegentibacter sp. TaxID=259320 RepID=UPI0025977A08|nr:carboxypeptidase-like regulatory domain-containing protein [uncultured Salegentibacter sp.]